MPPPVDRASGATISPAGWTKPALVGHLRPAELLRPGAYDAVLVAQLAEERGLPFLEIEVGFPFEASGPLRTRVEAFLEAQLLDDDLLDDIWTATCRRPLAEE